MYPKKPIRIVSDVPHYRCSKCAKWKAEDKFHVDNSRWNCRCPKCTKCRKVKQ